MNCRGRCGSRPGLRYLGSGLVAIGGDPTLRVERLVLGEGALEASATSRWVPQSLAGPSQYRTADPGAPRTGCTLTGILCLAGAAATALARVASARTARQFWLYCTSRWRSFARGAGAANGFCASSCVRVGRSNV